MNVTFDKNQEAPGVKVSKARLIRHTFQNESNVIYFIATHMYIFHKIKGGLTITGGLVTSTLATQGILAITDNIFVAGGLFILLAFATYGAMSYGIASLFDMAIVNRIKFVESVIQEIEKEATERIEDMEDKAMIDIIAKASGLPGFEGMDIMKGQVNPKTGEHIVEKVVTAKKDKKTTKN